LLNDKNTKMGEYKKITKDDIVFPQYCLYFIEIIQDEINNTDFSIYSDITLTIETSKYPYCYDAFELVVRTFERKGWMVNIPTFKTYIDSIGKKVYKYKFNIKELNYNEDLPF